MNEAILFPGQGAQFEGMGVDWCEAFPAARETFERADDVLGFSLTRACWQGGEIVNRTDIAQPGIFVTSAAILNVLRSHGLDPSRAPLVAGLSLGEYTALWAVGSLEFVDALRLVRLRGEAMQAASEARPSSMLALTGADEAQARTLAEVGSRAGICSVANLNAPGQIILSGELGALEAVEKSAKEYGVRRTRRLVVAGGFHSECMRAAADRLAAALDEIEIEAPRAPFASNVTGETVSDPAAIRAFLAQQVCSPVLWEKTMRGALARGIRRFLEIGPGKVLAGLMSRIDETALVRAAAAPADLAPT